MSDSESATADRCEGCNIDETEHGLQNAKTSGGDRRVVLGTPDRGAQSRATPPSMPAPLPPAAAAEKPVIFRKGTLPSIAQNDIMDVNSIDWHEELAQTSNPRFSTLRPDDKKEAVLNNLSPLLQDFLNLDEKATFASVVSSRLDADESAGLLVSSQGDAGTSADESASPCGSRTASERRFAEQQHQPSSDDEEWLKSKTLTAPTTKVDRMLGKSEQEEGVVESRFRAATMQAATKLPRMLEIRDSVILEGQLTKQGALHKNWKLRHFVLTPDSLLYFANQDMESRALGSIMITDTTEVKIDSEIMSKDFCFQVINRARTFYVHADNKRNMDKWIIAIRECISGEHAMKDQTSNPVYQGFLFKRGHMRKNWKRRWFLLKNHVLYYYNNEKDITKANGSIALDTFTTIGTADVHPSHPYCFYVASRDKTLYMDAANEEERDQWKEVLRRATIKEEVLPGSTRS